MHKLVRAVRFSVNPFLEMDAEGANSFSSKPCGAGLAMFLEFSAGVVGQADEDTGFVVNVVDIDKCVRKYVVPIFADRIRSRYKAGEHIDLAEVTELLRLAGKELADKFDGPMVAEVSLKLNPYRKIAMDCEDWKMVYFSEKFEFAAMHKLWNDKFSDEKNFEVFGKCANPAGHGHNYTVEVTVKMGEDVDLCVGDFERIVDGRFIELVDHKNLNVDIDHFAKLPATVENIAVLAWEKLNDQFKDARLHSVTVWETDKTNCTYYG